MKRFFAVVLLLFALLPTAAYAHGGGTDSNGGHIDSSTGEYHYHHGYSAHDHYDMDGDGDVDCPYDFDDKTGENSGSSSSSGSSTTKPTATPSPTATRQISLFTTPSPTATPEAKEKTVTAWDIIKMIPAILILGIIPGHFVISLVILLFQEIKDKFKK